MICTNFSISATDHRLCTLNVTKCLTQDRNQSPVKSCNINGGRRATPIFYRGPDSTGQAEEPRNTVWAGALSFPQLTNTHREAFSDSTMNHCPASLLKNMKQHLSMFTI
jgi:hypothetical protein